MDSRKDVTLALAIVALGLAVISLTLSFPEPVVKDRIGPQAFPLGIGLLFLFGGSVLAVQRMRNLNAAHGFRVTSEGNEDEPGYPASGMRALLIVAICLGYTMLLKPLGFLLATPPFVALALMLMQERKPVLVVVTSLVYTAATYLIIVILLGARLPAGVLAGIVR